MALYVCKNALQHLCLVSLCLQTSADPDLDVHHLCKSALQYFCLCKSALQHLGLDVFIASRAKMATMRGGKEALVELGPLSEVVLQRHQEKLFRLSAPATPAWRLWMRHSRQSRRTAGMMSLIAKTLMFCRNGVVARSLEHSCSTANIVLCKTAVHNVQLSSNRYQDACMHTRVPTIRVRARTSKPRRLHVCVRAYACFAMCMREHVRVYAPVCSAALLQCMR